MSHVRRCARLAASLSTSIMILAIAVAALAAPRAARAQNGYVAAIAYSQSTGKIGHTVRQARTEEAAKSFAMRACNQPDAKVFMWAQDQWVAIATADGLTGAAGFGRGRTSDEAQQKALAECEKRAHGAPCRVELCVHSAGSRARQLRKVEGDPQLVAARQAGYVAAIAYSPKTGKIGSTAGAARTKKEAHEIALKQCDAPDAKVFMWGPEWVAIATVEGRPGVAGFAPGATREIAERAALEQAEKLSRGGKCQVALAIHAAATPKPNRPPTPKRNQPQQPSPQPPLPPRPLRTTFIVFHRGKDLTQRREGAKKRMRLRLLLCAFAPLREIPSSKPRKAHSFSRFLRGSSLRQLPAAPPTLLVRHDPC